MKLRYTETGEIRSPLTGEFFRGNRGEVVQARFDFSETKFPILKEELIEDYDCPIHGLQDGPDCPRC